MRRSTLFILLLIASFYHSAAQGGEAATIRLKSIYRLSSADGWGNEIHWNLEKKSDGEILVRADEIPDVEYRLKYAKDKRLERVSQMITKNGKTEEKILEVSSPENPFLLSDGFPLPYDDLCVEDSSITEAVYRKKAGGASFAFKISRKTENWSSVDASAANMIDSGFNGRYDGEVLKLITVTENSRPKVKQLWHPGEPWWIYEETPFRKSWRMP